MGFWDWIRRKKDGEWPVKSVRNIGDIQIRVSTGLSGTRDVKISGWNDDQAQRMFWQIWDGLREREGR